MGDVIQFDIYMGTEEQPAEDVYGFTFPIQYNPDFFEPDGINLSFDNGSWLNYSSGAISMTKNDFKGKHMPTIIFDRGMVSEENINLIESEPYCLKYIVASRSGEEGKFISEFQNSTFKTITDKSEKNKVEIFLKE